MPPSPELTALSIKNAPKKKAPEPVITPEGQAAAQRIAQARASRTPRITPDSLQGATAPVVTPVPAPTLAPKLASDIATQAEDTFNQKLAADTKAAGEAKNTSLQSYLDELKSAQGLTTLTANAYATPGGVDEITPELNDINDQIRREQRSLDLAKRNITEKGGGLAGGAQAEINNLERVSLQKQADLSIIQMAIQGRYDSAKEIADRSVAAQFEEQQQALDIAKFDYTENKDVFTKAEQREYDSLFADRQNQIAEAKQNKQSIYELGIQASADGAPASVVQRMLSAKTREEALGIGGSYIGALDRQQKIASINASNRSNQPDLITSTANIPSYEAWKTANGYDLQSMTPEQESKLREEYNQEKQQFVLSTLDPLTQAIASNPDQYYSLSATGKEKVLPELVAAGIKLPRNLTSEQEKAANLSDNGLFALQQMEELITDDNGQYDVSFIQANNPFSKFSNLRRSVTDAISRISSGAALTTDEVNFYTNQTPSSFDTPEVIDQKRTNLAVFFSGISGNPVTLVSPNGEYFVFEDMFNPDVRRDLRDAVQAGYSLADY